MLPLPDPTEGPVAPRLSSGTADEDTTLADMLFPSFLSGKRKLGGKPVLQGLGRSGEVWELRHLRTVLPCCQSWSPLLRQLEWLDLDCISMPCCKPRPCLLPQPAGLALTLSWHVHSLTTAVLQVPSSFCPAPPCRPVHPGPMR